MKYFDFNNKNILITGGTGSFGASFINYLITNFKKVKKIVVFSRDELKQFEMKKRIDKKMIDKFRFFIGDVRDQKRLVRAFDKIDIVIHAAALKQVDTGEYDPLEFVNTNILGAQNIIEASLSTNVKKVVALSTDKAAAPVNLYGATKLCSDKLFSSANNLVGNKDLKFSIVRYGNVLGSRGSILYVFLDQKKNGKKISLTNKNMTRFNILMEDSIKMVSWCLQNMKGGEIFVPKLNSYRVIDFAKVFSKEKDIKIIGIRAGEKIHEEMITSSDSYNTYNLGNYYAICNPLVNKSFNYYKNLKKFKAGESYNSGKNVNFLKTDQIRKMIKNYIKLNKLDTYL